MVNRAQTGRRGRGLALEKSHNGGQHHVIPLDWVEKTDDKV